jgi:putative hemolysin
LRLDDLINDYGHYCKWINNELSHIPKQGEKLIWNHFELEVIDMDGVKIDKVIENHL